MEDLNIFIDDTAQTGLFTELATFLKKIRFIEVFLMTGFVFISVPFIKMATQSWFVLIPLFFGTIFLYLSIYSLNNFFGYHSDKLNARFKNAQFDNGQTYLFFSALTYITGLLIYSFVSLKLVGLGCMIFFLWACYGHPMGAKGKPFFGTLIHFVGQILQFHLGIYAFGKASRESFFVSLFFAFLFCSGHLIHELKDYHADLVARIRTNVVIYGPVKILKIYKTFVLSIFVFWLALYLAGAVTFNNFAPFLLASAGHAYLAGTKNADELTIIAKNEKFQKNYRFLYLGAGIITFLMMAR